MTAFSVIFVGFLNLLIDFGTLFAFYMAYRIDTKKLIRL